MNEFKHKPVMTQVTPLLQACIYSTYRWFIDEYQVFFKNIYAPETACDAALQDLPLPPVDVVPAWEWYLRGTDFRFCSAHEDQGVQEHFHDEPFHGDSSYPTKYLLIFQFWNVLHRLFTCRIPASIRAILLSHECCATAASWCTTGGCCCGAGARLGFPRFLASATTRVGSPGTFWLRCKVILKIFTLNFVCLKMLNFKRRYWLYKQW